MVRIKPKHHMIQGWLLVLESIARIYPPHVLTRRLEFEMENYKQGDRAQLISYMFMSRHSERESYRDNSQREKERKIVRNRKGCRKKRNKYFSKFSGINFSLNLLLQYFYLEILVKFNQIILKIRIYNTHIMFKILSYAQFYYKMIIF